MRKLKLQMHITVDGFVAGPEGQLDWIIPSAGDAPDLQALAIHHIDTSDAILLGRKMTGDFVKSWEHVTTQPSSADYSLGKKMVDTPKIMFSKTAHSVSGQNIRVENGPLVEAINRLKRQAGKDIIVYGGANFVSSLLENKLIDELNLFVNPVSIGEGLRIFGTRHFLKLVTSTAYPSGIVVNTYQPQ